MIISEKWLWFGLSGCLYCGSLGRNADGLCAVCSEDLWEWQRKTGGLFHQKIHKLEVQALFRWLPGKQEVLSRLLRALKGEGGEKLWRIYAEEFLRLRIPDKASSKAKPFLLIPAPSRTGKEDHARYFAKALIQLGLNAEICNCLSRGNVKGSQKKRSRRLRQKARLEWAENFTLSDFNAKSVGKHIIFIDDVVTTGSTAMAAWKTLDKPRDFAVWALAQRSLSCGATRNLL